MKFRQIGLHVTNLDRAVAFYTNFIGKEPIAQFNPPGFAFFDMEGVRLLLDVNAPQSAVYLEVENVRTTIEKLRATGTKVVSEPHVVFPDPNGIFDTPGNEWLAFIEDSEGNMVGIMSREIVQE